MNKIVSLIDRATGTSVSIHFSGDLDAETVGAQARQRLGAFYRV